MKENTENILLWIGFILMMIISLNGSLVYFIIISIIKIVESRKIKGNSDTIEFYNV